MNLIIIKTTQIRFFNLFKFSQKAQSNLRLPSFNHFNLQDGVFKFLQQQKIHTPTFIQYALLSSLKQNYNKIHHITSPTGSGKTLAYMLPIINHLKQQEIQQGGALTQSMRPRALVVTLNKQLALQTRNVGKGISHFCKIKCEGLNLGKSMNQQAKCIQDGIDILISTHKRLTGYIQRKKVYLSNLDWIVIDEVDTFCQSGALTGILQSFKQLYNPSNSQKTKYSRLLLSGTTNSEKLKQTLKDSLGGDYIELMDKNCHINLQNIKHEFLQSFEQNKHQMLRSLISRQKNMKTLIFCNTVNSLLDLQYFLQSQGIKVATLHSQLAKNLRRTNYQRFRDSEQNIMLSTDLGGRGLDFPNLQRVINYDFPLSTSDYLQRAGRTGRAGKHGLVITIYRKKDLEVINQLKGSSFDKPIKIKNSAYSVKNREDSKRSKYIKRT